MGMERDQGDMKVTSKPIQDKKKKNKPKVIQGGKSGL